MVAQTSRVHDFILSEPVDSLKEVFILTSRSSKVLSELDKSWRWWHDNLQNSIQLPKQAWNTSDICSTHDNARVSIICTFTRLMVTKLITRFLISLVLLPPARPRARATKQMRKQGHVLREPKWTSSRLLPPHDIKSFSWKRRQRATIEAKLSTLERKWLRKSDDVSTPQF